MANFTGLKINFNEEGEAKVVAGEKIKPHRLDLLKEKIAAEDIMGLDSVFFNFHVPGHRNISTLEQIQEEQKLYQTYKQKLFAMNAAA